MSQHEEDPRDAAPRPQAPAFDIWGFAARLVDDVKSNADSFVTTIVETDWKHELETIQDTLKEDTQSQVEASTSASTSGAQPPTRSAGGHAEPAASSFSFVDLGQSLVTGASEWLDQVQRTVDSEMAEVTKGAKRSTRARSARLDTGSKYNRLQSEIKSMQRRSSTYSDEPQDTVAFAAFLESFDLEARDEEIRGIMHDNAFMSELHSRIVPVIVEHDVFWQRYFFRVEELQRQHKQRKLVVARAATHRQDDEDDTFKWDDTSPLGRPGSDAAQATIGGDTVTDAAPDAPAPADCPADPGSPAPESPHDATPAAPPAPASPASPAAAAESSPASAAASVLDGPASPGASPVQGSPQAAGAASEAAGAGDTGNGADTDSVTGSDAPEAAEATPVSGQYAQQQPQSEEAAAAADAAAAGDAAAATGDASEDTAAAQQGAAAQQNATAGVGASGGEGGAGGEGALPVQGGSESAASERATSDGGSASPAGASARASDTQRSSRGAGSMAASDWSIVSGQQCPTEQTTPTSAAAAAAQQADAQGEGSASTHANGSVDLDVVDEDVDLDDEDASVSAASPGGADSGEVDEDWGEWE